MSEGIQITIPDFEDDDYNSSTIPFGRSAGGTFGHSAFSSGFGSSGSGPDSPTLMTPIADRASERTYFNSHNRGDSVTSVESSSSFTQVTRFPNRSTTSFAHSSQSSIAVPNNSGGLRKPSFASIRNAFSRGGKPYDAPPVPQLDYQSNSVMRSPFNRSTSSLNAPSARNPSLTQSPPFGRPPTPSDARSRAAVKLSKGHSHAKSYHSQSGSIHHASDGSEGHGYPFTTSPPPLPRFPTGIDSMNRSDTPDVEDDKVVMDPKTPSDFALHAVFIRFAAIAEGKIDMFLRQNLEQGPLLQDILGPEVDPKFDDTLDSLGKIAHKHTKPVVDSIMRWRRSQLENVGSAIIRYHMSQSTGPNRTIRTHDVPGLLNERKSLVSIYIMCRALIAVLKSLPKDALGDAAGHTLETMIFEQFKRPDLKLLSLSANHRTNADLYATLLGYLANVRFVSVTDRFLAELSPIAHGQVPKDMDMKYENLVQGIRHIQIKVWPPEAFEEGAEFLESLAKSFAQAHGFRLKRAYAEMLTHLLHPIGKTAQAETNNPLWAKAIEMIYPKAKEMMAKPRYWHVAFPLVITTLCVAPDNLFRKHWILCFESCLSKLKEKSARIIVLNGLMRLIWTYLYRCQDSASTTATKLDGLLKYFFPPNRLNVFPQDAHIEPFIYITHFVLSRHFEYGRNLCLELMQEPQINAANKTGGSISAALAPERTAVAVHAILLSLSAIERESPAPTWPSGSDFSDIPSSEDYPSSSDFAPPALLARPSIQDFFDRFGAALATVASFCGASVGQMSVFDDQWSYSRLNVAHEEVHNFVIRRHPEGGSVVYPNNLVPHITLLQTCFHAWPRCLHSSLPTVEAVDMLLRGVIHVEPLLCEAACAALSRFIADPSYCATVLSTFNQYLFSPARSQEGSGVRLVAESLQLMSMWTTVVSGWINNLLQQSMDALVADQEVIASRCYEIEAGGLFLMAHESQQLYKSGVAAIRQLYRLIEHIQSLDTSSQMPLVSLTFVKSLNGSGLEGSFLIGFDEFLEKGDVARLNQWREQKRADTVLRIADSSNDKDRKLWRYIFPIVMQAKMENADQSLASFRDMLAASASRYHPIISHVAGLSSRVPPALSGRVITQPEKDGYRLVQDNKSTIDQWYMWVKILCSTATIPDHSRPALTQLGRDHSRAPSDISFERERLTTTRGLFRYLTPFLDSEYTIFRDAAVLCISSFPPSAYPHLLEDLSLLAGRQFYDDPRAKAGSPLLVETNVSVLTSRQGYDTSKIGITGERTRRQERLHSAVARIYYLTAHNLQDQRSACKPAALSHVLKFVRNTQAFLTSPEMRENYTLQRLRRYFCGTVERLFDALSTLEGTDRFVPSHTHLTLYRLCEEWCQFGLQSEIVKQRMQRMQQDASSADSKAQTADSLERFQSESRALSFAAVGALSSLCQKAFSPPGISSGSPTEKQAPEHLKSLTSSAVLERLGSILASDHTPSQERAKKALKSLLTQNSEDPSLIDECIRRSVLMSDQQDSSISHFFEVVSEMICGEKHSFSFPQVVCLGLANLCYPHSMTRRHAFNMLEAIHQQSAGILTMSQFEAPVMSTATGSYMHAHRLVADFLAGEHPEQAAAILSRVAGWLPQFYNTSSFNVVNLVVLQSLELWVPNIELMTEDKSGLSREGHSAIYHLMALSLRYGQTHTEQILTLWTRLVDTPHESNGHATVRFLLEQSHKVGSSIFINVAANIVSCLCQTSIGPRIFSELCSVIEPARMLPTIEHKLTFPEAHDMELWSDLDALFSDGQPRLSLGSSQFAWLFLSEVTLQRYWELSTELPLLLHALFAHFDHRHGFVRERARSMLFLLLRSWAPGYDELSDRTVYRSRSVIKDAISALEAEARTVYWAEDDKNPEIGMRELCNQVINILEPLCPSLRERWGSLALSWGTSCSIRAIAFRSLQIFRALASRVRKSDLSLLLGRLSNTIAAPDDNIQSFSCEIISTLDAIASSPDLDITIVPQMFWVTCACLSTPIEKEFSHVNRLFQVLLTRLNLDDPNTIESIMAQLPEEWKGTTSVQSALLKGLRSSVTSPTTMVTLQTLTKFADGRLIDSTKGRVRDLYTLSLPWCLHAMTADQLPDDELRCFAEAIGELGKQEGRSSIYKIMTSFAKSHFRTKDDFLRQSVSSLREHYGGDNWTDIVTLLMGLVLNGERWLRIQTMQILKVLFQQRETRNPVELLGSEILMPLLRLLDTDLAAQALDVLEEPMAMSGGLPAKHVLRMSMHTHILPMAKDANTAAVVFGPPDESGWSVPKPEALRDMCRENVTSVFGTCSMNTRPSQIEFEPEVEALAGYRGSVAIAEEGSEDLGGLVQNLHDLTTFFQDDDTQSGQSHTSNNTNMRRLEARVAAILAKSTSPLNESDVPPTPFVDVFRVGPVSDDESEDCHSNDGSDSELDAFIFDSPVALYRSARNGTRFH